MLRYLIIFSTLLMTALNVRAQCEMPAVGENMIMTEIPDQETFPEGSTVKFRCSTGYIPVRALASRSITCNGNQWSKLQLQCKKKSCGNPGEVFNGKYLFPDGILYGATIRAQCNEGYRLVGQSMRNCRENGWDERPPVCEVVKCLPPPSVIDGIFEPVEELYDYGEGVLYSCKRGLDLFGSSLLTCSNNGTFQPAPPRCLFVTCERPEILNADRIEGKSPPYKYRDFVRYQCNKGYKIEGSDLLICKEDGWDPLPPQCNIVTCSPPVISNGQFYPQKRLYEYSNTVTYTCNEGFRLKGPARRSCTEYGTFQPPPWCQEITCDPQTIQNVILESPELYKYNSSIKIRCDKGYRTEGSDQLTCGVKGWIPHSSPCTVVTCSPPPGISNGRFYPQKALYVYRNSVTYTCNDGFTLEGSATISCTEYGTFQPSPECQIVTCSPPPGISNGRFYPQKALYVYRNSVTYTCNDGFRLKGSATISCTEYGIFQRSPECQIVTCSPPPGISNGRFYPQKALYVYRNSVTYTCNDGFTLEGSAKTSCNKHGTFHPPPRCQEITCDPQTIQNVILESPEPYKYNSSIKIRCDKGYRTEGSDQLTCGVNGWFPHSSPCTAYCDAPSIGGNRILTDDPGESTYPEGFKLTYKCFIGYLPVQAGGLKSITCKGKQWTELQLQCQLKSCGHLGELANGKYLTPNGILFGATATAQCDTGYTVVGEKTRNCRDNGWDGRDPVCEVVKCEPPPNIQNGTFAPMDKVYNYNHTVTYSCDKDYTLIGESTIVCPDNGTFTPPPLCLYVTCDELDITDGFIIGDKSAPYGYNSSVQFQCNNGYKTEECVYLTCKENGWNPPPSQCCSDPDIKPTENPVNMSSSMPPAETSSESKE